jgi:hypothetical protein
MGESKRRRGRQATRGEKRGATLRRRWGAAEFDLCISPLIETAIRLPKSAIRGRLGGRMLGKFLSPVATASSKARLTGVAARSKPWSNREVC